MEYINLNHLRAFYFVAKEKSITKAANLLNLQQPGLSKTIKKLEESLAVKLLYRDGKGINLTNEGQEILGKCEGIFQQVKSLENFSNRQDLKLTDSFKIYTNDAISTCLLPEVIIKQKDEFPHIRPIILLKSLQETYEDLQAKKVDLGIYHYIPKLPSDLRVIKKIPIQYKLVISRDKYHSEITRSQFIGSRETENPSETNYPVVEIMKKNWPNTQIHYSSNSLLTHKEMVLSGMGVSVLPEYLIKNELSSGRIKELLPSENFKYSLKIIGRKNERLTTYSKEIIHFFNQLL